MSTQPDLSFHANSSPYVALTNLNFIQSKDGGNNLPVLHGENSNPIIFRIYNNFARNIGIASALNVAITTFDGASVASHTALRSPVSQSWLHLLENGFGENSVPIPDLLTQYKGFDTPVGGSNFYYAEKGSNGNYGDSIIRAGTNENGVGFIEYEGYCSVPENAGGENYPFVISIIYEWAP